MTYAYNAIAKTLITLVRSTSRGGRVIWRFGRYKVAHSFSSYRIHTDTLNFEGTWKNHIKDSIMICEMGNHRSPTQPHLEGNRE